MAKLNLELSFPMVFNSDTAPLVAVRDWYEYVDGKKQKLLGMQYDLLMLNSACDKLTVRVPDEAPIIEQTQLDTANASCSFIMVKCAGFTAKPYAKDGQMQISAKAQKIVIVPPTTK